MCQADFSCEHSITTGKSAQRHTIEKKNQRGSAFKGHKYLERKKGEGRTIRLNEPGRIHQ